MALSHSSLAVGELVRCQQEGGSHCGDLRVCVEGKKGGRARLVGVQISSATVTGPSLMASAVTSADGESSM